jgi:type IV secretory pathway VirB2 component (pilin)
MKDRRIVAASLIICAVLISTPIYAGYDIGGEKSGIFAKLTEFLQDIVDFLDGPAAVAIVVVSLIAAIVLWNVAPGRSEWVGRTFRAVASAIFLLDVGLIINYLRT